MKKGISNMRPFCKGHTNLAILMTIIVFGTANHASFGAEPESIIALRVEGEIYRLGMVEDEGQRYLSAKTPDGQVVRDAATLKKIFYVQHVYRFTFTKPNESLRLEQLDRGIEDLQAALNMSYLSDAVLLLRDVSARALCEAILAASSGGSSIGKTVAEAAAISYAKAFVKDPVTYAKGINYLTMQSALTSLQRARAAIRDDIRSGNFTYERAKQIEQDIIFGLSRSNTSQVLQGQLYLTSGGGGDLVSQLEKIGTTMLDQLIGKVSDAFKYKQLIDEALVGAKLINFVIENCPAYAKYVRETQENEKLFGYETSQYYKDVVEPTIKHWCDTDEKTTDNVLSSPEEVLKRWYEGLVQMQWQTLVRTVSSDGEFDRWKNMSEADWEKEISKINAEGGDVFSYLLKVVFVKKGLYQGHEAVAVKEYYPRELNTERFSLSSAYFETNEGKLVKQSDDSVRYVIAPHIFTFKKEYGEWKVHMEYGPCLTPLNPKPGDILSFEKMEEEVQLDYTFISDRGNKSQQEGQKPKAFMIQLELQRSQIKGHVPALIQRTLKNAGVKQSCIAWAHWERFWGNARPKFLVVFCSADKDASELSQILMAPRAIEENVEVTIARMRPLYHDVDFPVLESFMKDHRILLWGAYNFWGTKGSESQLIHSNFCTLQIRPSSGAGIKRIDAFVLNSKDWFGIMIPSSKAEMGNRKTYYDMEKQQFADFPEHRLFWQDWFIHWSAVSDLEVEGRRDLPSFDQEVAGHELKPLVEKFYATLNEDKRTGNWHHIKDFYCQDAFLQKYNHRGGLVMTESNLLTVPKWEIVGKPIMLSAKNWGDFIEDDFIILKTKAFRPEEFSDVFPHRDNIFVFEKEQDSWKIVFAGDFPTIDANSPDRYVCAVVAKQKAVRAYPQREPYIIGVTPQAACEALKTSREVPFEILDREYLSEDTALIKIGYPVSKHYVGGRPTQFANVDWWCFKKDNYYAPTPWRCVMILNTMIDGTPERFQWPNISKNPKLQKSLLQSFKSYVSKRKRWPLSNPEYYTIYSDDNQFRPEYKRN